MLDYWKVNILLEALWAVERLNWSNYNRHKTERSNLLFYILRIERKNDKNEWNKWQTGLKSIRTDERGSISKGVESTVRYGSGESIGYSRLSGSKQRCRCVMADNTISWLSEQLMSPSTPQLTGKLRHVTSYANNISDFVMLRWKSVEVLLTVIKRTINHTNVNWIMLIQGHALNHSLNTCRPKWVIERQNREILISDKVKSLTG